MVPIRVKILDAADHIQRRQLNPATAKGRSPAAQHMLIRIRPHGVDQLIQTPSTVIELRISDERELRPGRVVHLTQGAQNPAELTSAPRARFPARLGLTHRDPPPAMI